MTFLDQLNLTPQERRIVVAIAMVIFVLLNLFLVWPHFNDLSRVRKQLEDTRRTMQEWNKEILKDVEPTNGYKKQLAKLERQQGGSIMNQQIQLQTTIHTQASRAGVNIDNYQPLAPSHATNNQFFEEQSEKITFESQESQLVNFLFNVGNDPAMVRVRELDLKPADANRYRLRGGVILTANYAKQPAAAPAAKPPAAGAKKPGGAAAPKTPPGAKPLPARQPFPIPRTPPGVPPARKNL